MKKIFLTLILLFSVNSAFAGLITKVKKRRFIFTTQGMNGIKKGSWVIVENDEGEKIYAKVLKKTKKAALAILRKKKNIGSISVGNEVTLKGQTSLRKAEEGENTASEEPKETKPTGSGFYIEPYLNYETGNWSQEANYIGFSDENKVTISASASGFQGGAFVGYKLMNLQLGLNVSMSKGSQSSRKLEVVFGGNETEELGDMDYTGMNIGVFLGYLIAEKWRPFITANTNTLELVSTSNSITKFSGISFSGGLGVKVAPNIFANLSLGMSMPSKENDASFPYESNRKGVPITVKAPTDLIAMAGISYYFGFPQ